jgi:hypothetical protein
MNKWLIVLLFLGFTNVACAENPNEIVRPRGSGDRAGQDSHGGSGKAGEIEEVELPAIRYSGVKTSGGACSVYVSVAEFEEADGEHRREILIKPEFTTADGHVAGGSASSEFLKFRAIDQSYYPEDQDVDGSILSLTGLAFVEGKEVENPDPNDLATYVDDVSLFHLLRIEYAGVSASQLDETIEAVVANRAMTDKQKLVLDRVAKFFAFTKHGTHYHGVSCVSPEPFQPMAVQQEVVVTKFELGPGHNDHDHDEGYYHRDDHDDHDDHQH